MLAAAHAIMEKLKLKLNVQKTRCLRCPEEPFEFLGYRIGWNYRRNGTGRYIGTRPSTASVQSICRKSSEQTGRRFGLLDAEQVVQHLNRMMSGWANYFTLGQVSPSYRAIDMHATKRLRQWFCRKHKVRSGKYVRFPVAKLRETYGLLHLAPKTKDLPWAKP